MAHKDPESRKIYYKQYNAKRYNTEEYKKQIRNYQLKLNYGLTAEEYQKLLEAQEYKCAICGKHESCFKKRLGVDHNHNTREVRGLLCVGCNKFIISNRNIDFFEKVLQYMKGSK